MATERKLDSETKKQLLGILPFSNESSIDYTPRQYDEIPEEFRPVFKLRAFNRLEQDQARGFMMKIGEVKGIDVEKKSREFVRKCVTGWDNLIDIGKEEYIDYAEDPIGGCDKELFASIPVSVVGDMFYYLSRVSGLLDLEKLGLNS